MTVPPTPHSAEFIRHHYNVDMTAREIARHLDHTEADVVLMIDALLRSGVNMQGAGKPTQFRSPMGMAPRIAENVRRAALADVYQPISLAEHYAILEQRERDGECP